MNINNINKALRDIEIALGKIEVHMLDIKQDLQDVRIKNKELELKVEELNNFKAKVLGAGTVIIAVATFVASIGHDLIKKIMGWN